MKTQSSSEDEWTIKEWRTTSEPRVIYIKPEDVPVCLVEKNSDWKPPEDCHTRYGMVDDPWEMKYLYEYFKENANEENQR